MVPVSGPTEEIEAALLYLEAPRMHEWEQKEHLRVEHGADMPVYLDLRGLKCPLPALRTKQALARLVSGDTLIVEATDPLAALDIAHLCAEQGDRLESAGSEGSVSRLTIRKSADDARD